MKPARSGPAHPAAPAILAPLAILAALSGLLFAAPAPARSQGAIDTIDIVQIDSTLFPDVRIQARILSSDDLPPAILTPDMLRLTENGQEQAFTLQAIEGGVQVALVADVGAGSGSAGASGATRLEEIRTLMARFVDSMGSSDSAAVILINEDGIQIIQPFTGDQQALRGAVAAIRADPLTGRLTNGPGAIITALEELEENPPFPRRAQAVLFFSSGIQTTTPVGYEALAERAAISDIPVHTVLCSASEPAFNNNLLRIAEENGGLYAYYRPDSDSVETIFTHLQRQRTHYLLTFRSSLSSTAERNIMLETRSGAGSARHTVTYIVSPQPPTITIEQPEPGTPIIRQLTGPDEPVDRAEPTSITVTARVDWPDGWPRALTSAQLLVDSQPYGTPLDDPGSALRFTWDLRPYRSLEENSAQLQVQVTDELGLSGISRPLPVVIQIEVPPLPEEPTCADESSFPARLICSVREGAVPLPLLIGIPALLVLLGAALIVWSARRQRGIIPPPAAPVLRGRPARLAPAVTPPAAWLIVVRGDEPLIGRRFPIHSGQITSIGRDRDLANVVLPGGEYSVVSRKHCEIRQEGRVFRLRDFASTHGTYLNGERLMGLVMVRLNSGDEIGLGPPGPGSGGVVLRFELAAGGAAAGNGSDQTGAS